MVVLSDPIEIIWQKAKNKKKKKEKSFQTIFVNSSLIKIENRLAITTQHNTTQHNTNLYIYQPWLLNLPHQEKINTN